MTANEAMTIKLDYDLPEYPKMDPQYRRAPRRESHLSESDKALAIGGGVLEALMHLTKIMR